MYLENTMPTQDELPGCDTRAVPSLQAVPGRCRSAQLQPPLAHQTGVIPFPSFNMFSYIMLGNGIANSPEAPPSYRTLLL